MGKSGKELFLETDNEDVEYVSQSYDTEYFRKYFLEN